MTFRNFNIKHDHNQITRLTAIAAIVVLGISIYLFHFNFSNNITGFFRIGSEFPKSPYLNPETAFIFDGEIGHDGQQFLTIAFDPLLKHPQTIEALDVPSYRYRRILYPALGYVLALGNRVLIPYMLVAINCLAAVFLTRELALYWQHHSSIQPLWKSLFVLCIPGVWFCLTLSTAGLLATTLAIAALDYYGRKPWLAAGLVALSCLTRETFLLYWVALVIASIMHRHRVQLKTLLQVMILPASWITYTFLRPDLQRNTELAVKNNFDVPFLGIIQKLQLAIASPFELKLLYEFLSFGLLIAVFLATIATCFSQRKRLSPILSIAIASLLNIILFTFCSRVVLNYYLDYNRVFLAAYCLLLLSIVTLPATSRLSCATTAIFSVSGINCLAYILLST